MTTHEMGQNILIKRAKNLKLDIWNIDTIVGLYLLSTIM